MNAQRDMKAAFVKNVGEVLILYICNLMGINSAWVNEFFHRNHKNVLVIFPAATVTNIAAICSPPCVAGFCAEIDLCECVTGYTGPTCSIAGKRLMQQWHFNICCYKVTFKV